MELTVLGKYGPYPKPGGACSGYLVKNGDDILLLDMGCGVLSGLLEYVDVTQLTAIFISHLHYDHTSDLLPLRYLLEDLHHTLTIYTAYEDSEWYRLLFRHPNFNIVNIDEDSVIHLPNTCLRFVKMQHACPDYGVVMQGDSGVLCYTGDTERCENVEKCCQACDVVLADCSKPSGSCASHMTVDDAKELAEAYCCRIIATHQSANYHPAQDIANNPLIIAAEENNSYYI